MERCIDNRFEIIAKYKQKLIESTNIEMAKDEMNVIDDILFRFWQMGWLEKLEADVVPRAEVEKAKQEVARKIFEDFTKHKVCTNEEDYRVLAELKKKYIGE